jgi:3-hydroxyacyl-CoA dehydrogenase/enoyl-CoA hydratase/3-hydroxybutyryl-CoA epimerase
MRTLTLKRRPDGVAVLLFDTPKKPVNVLSGDLLREAGPLMEEIQGDDEIVACVLASAKPDSFIAGADLDQVVGMTAADAEAVSRGAHEWLDRVAESRKPFVAAIHGAALGGGLEVALACHYRIASDHPKTVLALPEVMLGVLPGAGGTQRLPRLVGLPRALPMLLTGKRIRALQAYRMGLVDALTSPGGLVETAAKAALALADGTLKPDRDRQPLSEKPLALPPLRGFVLGKAREEVMKKTRGLYAAPLEILACVEKGLEDGIAAGQEEEAVRFGKLVGSEPSKNLIRLFDAMTALKKGPKGEEPASVRRLGVLGAGLMGEGIAAVSLGLGPVVLKDVSEEGLSRAARSLRKGLDRRLRSGALTRLERDRQWYGLRPTMRPEDLAGCDLVVEAVFEDLALKRKVLAETEDVIGPEAVFASNTSALPIREIAAQAKEPSRVVGMHYFSPVPKMPLLEVVVAEKTSPRAVATARAFGVAQGKTVIVVRDGPGFYTTRILGPFVNEAVVLLDEGAAIPDLDAALLEFGFPVGPVALLDEVGIDVAAHVSNDLGKAFAARGAAPSATFRKLFDAGFRGRKNAKGFYLYPKERPPHAKKDVNPDVLAFFGGSVRKRFAKEDLVDRLALLMVNEAAWCLAEGVVASPRDADAGAVLGLGFPPFRGGPFRHVDAVGAREIVGRMEELAESHGKRFEPAPLLVEAAKKGTRFHG